MRVFQANSGKWYVDEGDIPDSGILSGPYDTNAQAWRALDSLQNEPHNAKESRHQWAALEWLKKG